MNCSPPSLDELHFMTCFPCICDRAALPRRLTGLCVGRLMQVAATKEKYWIVKNSYQHPPIPICVLGFASDY